MLAHHVCFGALTIYKFIVSSKIEVKNYQNFLLQGVVLFIEYILVPINTKLYIYYDLTYKK